MIVIPLWVMIVKSDSDDIPSLLSNPYITNVVGFSLFQAGLSTILSVGLAIPAAHSLARQTSFLGRASLLRLFSVSLVIPSIVAVYGIVAIYGNNGWLNQSLNYLGIENSFSIYGLSGILLAHIFFNLPLSIRIMLQALEDIPASNWRLASQLGMDSLQCFILLQWAVLKTVIPGITLLVFTLCFTSFAIVMTLGGGPAATTIEVAIYQALRFDFDLGLASALALLQMGICLTLILLSIFFGRSTITPYNKTSVYLRQDGNSRNARIIDSFNIVLVVIFISSPLAAIVYSGVSADLLSIVQTSNFWMAALNSLLVSILAGLLSVFVAYGLVGTSTMMRISLCWYFPAKLVELSGSIILIAPPLVLGTGLFLLLRDYVDIFSIALPLTVVINALMSLPFVIRILESPMLHASLDHDRLCHSLNMSGWNRFKIATWPVLRKPIALALAFACTLAAGDLTIIALFGSEDIKTLPLLLFQLMGSYQFESAAAMAFVLLIYCLGMFWVIESWVGGKVHNEGAHAGS